MKNSCDYFNLGVDELLNENSDGFTKEECMILDRDGHFYDSVDSLIAALDWFHNNGFHTGDTGCCVDNSGRWFVLDVHQV